MRFRWPFLLRSTCDGLIDAGKRQFRLQIGDLEGKLGLAAEERKGLEAEVVRLGQEKADVELIRDEWCEEYRKVRDDRDRLRARLDDARKALGCT